MNQLAEQLHDIEGIDPVSMWPLAAGWWILIALSFCFLLLIGFFLIKWITFKRSWKNDTLKKLSQLESSLQNSITQDTVVVLSEILRRIALRRFSRKECAALVDEEWLNWLTTHDPKKFNWQEHGKLLIECPYAPQTYQVEVSQLKVLIQAAREWVR